MEIKRMNEMKAGERGIICAMDGTGQWNLHFSRLGITCGTEVQCVSVAPFGDPLSYRVGETVFVFRRCDTEKIQVEIHW